MLRLHHNDLTYQTFIMLDNCSEWRVYYSGSRQVFWKLRFVIPCGKYNNKNNLHIHIILINLHLALLSHSLITTDPDNPPLTAFLSFCSWKREHPTLSVTFCPLSYENSRVSVSWVTSSPMTLHLSVFLSSPVPPCQHMCLWLPCFVWECFYLQPCQVFVLLAPILMLLSCACN